MLLNGMEFLLCLDSKSPFGKIKIDVPERNVCFALIPKVLSAK